MNTRDDLSLRAAVEQIWGGPGCEIPTVHAMPWRDVIPSPYRAACAHPDWPVIIGDIRPLPRNLGALGPWRQLLACGEVLLGVFGDLIPAFNYSLAGGRVVLCDGITIMLAVLNRGEVLLVPWSLGEPRDKLRLRMRYWRRRAPVRLNAAEAFVLDRYLPRPQAVVSIVGQLGPRMPLTSILASGGGCPIAIAVGSEAIGWAFDHRVYDAAPAGVLYRAFDESAKGME